MEGQSSGPGVQGQGPSKVSSKLPRGSRWPALGLALLLLLLALAGAMVGGLLGLAHNPAEVSPCSSWLFLPVIPTLPMPPSALAHCPQPMLQAIRWTFLSPSITWPNQTATVDLARDTVTYVVTPPQSNRSWAVLFDSHNGYVCYRPGEQRSCFLRRMETWDRDALQSVLNSSQVRDLVRTIVFCQDANTEVQLAAPRIQLQEHKGWGEDKGPLFLASTADWPLGPNKDTRYTKEFLGVLAGHEVDPALVGSPVQNLCDQLPIYWVQRAEGSRKQRLIYLCIDICFPSNICVSVCFYYLPD
ncbi:BRICHOS domain-containing protein 5 [Monodelphis domestica]|uniref:BRICHOS domain-containing protein 5 n=1 Tax=Monodelphis domestica TaxID=13616 RepID=UPI0024E25CE9|nr:BRICHOS domain-containing protein 5 [Monodelphis domestica]